MFNSNIGKQIFDRFKSQSSFKDGSLGGKYIKKGKKKKNDDDNLFDEDDDNSARYSDESFSLEDMLGEDFDKNDNNTVYDVRQPQKKNVEEPPEENFFEKGL